MAATVLNTDNLTLITYQRSVKCQGMERNLSTISIGTRKRRGEGHTRRDEILIAAKDLFLREGYQATTIRRIAEVVGVSAPALYLYFKDKDAILIALCDQTFSSLIEVMEGMESSL